MRIIVSPVSCLARASTVAGLLPGTLEALWRRGSLPRARHEA